MSRLAPALAVIAALVALTGPARAATGDATDDADRSKGVSVSDLGMAPDKLPHVGKVKECCGYPIGDKQQYRLSFYWLAYESEYANEPYDTDIYDQHGFWLGRYPSAFVYELVLEGSGILRDGRVINYDGSCKYGIGTCFKQLDERDHPLGRGVQGRPLVPFRSVAVDPRYIPIGSPIYVPELVGMTLPDGTRHDGCLRADDQGGAIKFQKIDFFVESYFNFKYLADQLWFRLKATPHLDEPRCEYLRLGEPRERMNEHVDWVALHTAKHRQTVARDHRALKARNRAKAAWAKAQRRGGYPDMKALGKRTNNNGNGNGNSSGSGNSDKSEKLKNGTGGKGKAGGHASLPSPAPKTVARRGGR